MGTLRNLGKQYLFTQGAAQDPRVLQELRNAARAAQVRRALRLARFGLLPGRNEQMQSTFVDEFRLLADLGPTIIPLSVRELERKAAGLIGEEVDTFIGYIHQNFRVQAVSAQTLQLAARSSLGLAHLAVDNRLDLISLNDITPELHEALGLRPCLYPPLLDQSAVSIGLEGDLGAATALFILKTLANSPALFMEIWFWDEDQNVIVGGHAGPQDPQAAAAGKAWISRDFEFAQTDRSEGAHLQFIARPGRVTMLQLRGTPQGWQAILVSGEAMDTGPWLEGYPHAVVCLDVKIDEFVRQVARVGSTQHWIMVYGDFTDELQAFFDLAGIPLEKISR
jgi:L-arabinose isomerase